MYLALCMKLKMSHVDFTLSKSNAPAQSYPHRMAPWCQTPQCQTLWGLALVTGGGCLW